MPATYDRPQPAADRPAPGRLADLMAGYQAGSLADFERLYVLLAPEVRRFLEEETGDEELAGELLVEAFHQMHRHRRTYRAPGSVRRWALDIAAYVARYRGGARGGIAETGGRRLATAP